MTPDSFNSSALTNYVVEFDPSTIYDGMYLVIIFPSSTILTSETSCEHVVCQRKGQTLIVHNYEKFTVTNITNPPMKTITKPF